MTTEIFFIIAVLALFFILILFWKQKDKAYRKGFSDGTKQVIRNMFDTATWLGIKEDKSSHNALWLFASKYKKYSYVCSDRFRKDLFSLDNRKRITDLQKKEIKRLV